MLKRDWFAVADGDIYPTLFPAGSELRGELLERARGLGLIEEKRTRKARVSGDAAATFDPGPMGEEQGA